MYINPHYFKRFHELRVLASYLVYFNHPTELIHTRTARLKLSLSSCHIGKLEYAGTLTRTLDV